MACFNNIDACGAGMHFYGIHNTTSAFELNADGFLGLGLDPAD
jgi:hypothetical protein